MKTIESNSVINYLITKKSWFGMTPFEYFLFVSGMIVMITLPIILKGVNHGYDFSGNPFNKEVVARNSYGIWDLILTIAAGIGILGALMLSTKNKHAWIILLIEAILYGANSFFVFESYALGSINMFFIPILLIFTHFFSWGKNNSGGTIITKKLGIKDMSIVISGVLILTGSLGTMFIFAFQGTNFGSDLKDWTAWIDALMASIMAIAFILSSLRYRETFVIFFISNIIKVLSWTIALHWTGAPEYKFEVGVSVGLYAGSLALAWIYLLNSMFGLLIWRHSRKTTFKKNV